MITNTEIKDAAAMSEEFVAMRDYSKNSASQNEAACLLSGMIEQVLGGMHFLVSSKSTCISVVEFGCATGSSSIDPLDKIISAPKINGRRVCAIMNDLPLTGMEV